MGQPKISCILPSYNRKSFLLQSLTALTTCGYKNLEIIVVEDGCDYGIRHPYFPDVKFIKLPKNSGTVTIPRNVGLSYATGEYIAHIDDDVITLPNKFVSLSKAMQDNREAVMAYGNRITVREGQSARESNSAQFALDKTEVGLDGGQFIYRASVYNHISPVFSVNACDWNTYKRFAHLGDFAYVNEAVCVYYWHGNNISLIPKEKRIDPLSVLGDYLPYFNPDNQSFLEKVTKCLK